MIVEKDWKREGNEEEWGMRNDEIINEEKIRRKEWIGKKIIILISERGDILRVEKLRKIEDLSWEIGENKRDLRSWKWIIDVGKDMFRRNKVIGEEIGIESDESENRKGWMGIGEKKIREVIDEEEILMWSEGKEERKVKESKDRNVEGIEEEKEKWRIERGVDIEEERKKNRMIGKKKESMEINEDEEGYDVIREGLMNIEEIELVGKRENKIINVVGIGGDVR